MIASKKTNIDNGNASGDDGSSDEPVDSNIYEKKLNILAVAHLILQKGQANANPGVLQIVIAALKDFLTSVCEYFIEFKAQKNMPSSSVFYT